MRKYSRALVVLLVPACEAPLPPRAPGLDDVRRNVDAIELCKTSERELLTAFGDSTRDARFGRLRMRSWLVSKDPERILAVALDNHSVAVDLLWDAPGGTTWIPHNHCVPPASPTTPDRPAMMTPKDILEKLFTQPHADPAWFQPSFSSKVPPSKVDEITRQVLATSGALQSVRPGTKENDFEIVFDKDVVEATLILEDGKIQTLWLRPGAAAAATLDEAISALKGLSGKVGFAVVSGGRTLTGANETKALAVGSAFKLAVLAELRLRIEKDKKLSWDQTVPLQTRWKSLPSGMLQDWPTGTPVTVQTLASLMISISDNTATDAVIDLVGRASLAHSGASQLRPFLTTGDMFRLKAKGNEALLARFRDATPTLREKLLEEIEKLPLPRVEDYPKGVTAPDVEWFFSPAELCELMSKVQHLPLMGINPGVAKKDDWDRIAYKGGSEPGVICMTTFVQKGPKAYCIAAAQNDERPVDEARFAFAYGAVLGFLAKNLP